MLSVVQLYPLLFVLLVGASEGYFINLLSPTNSRPGSHITMVEVRTSSQTQRCLTWMFAGEVSQGAAIEEIGGTCGSEYSAALCYIPLTTATRSAGSWSAPSGLRSPTAPAGQEIPSTWVGRTGCHSMHSHDGSSIQCAKFDRDPQADGDQATARTMRGGG